MNLMDKLFPRRAIKAQLQELLALPWSVRDETALKTLARYLGDANALGAAAAYGRTGQRAAALPYALNDGVATIEIVGPILRGESWIMDYFGEPYARTEEIERSVLMAAADPSVKRVCLCIDSPGGTTAGLQAAADAIAACNSRKPVEANVTGQCCSAAYMLASQAGTIRAMSGAPIGSIGTYMVLVDSSKAAAAEGIEVLVIRSGEMKGVGTSGAPITEKQRATLQAFVDASQAVFNDYVAKGRKMSLEQVQALATGEFWLASEAQAKGLVDSVGPQNLGAQSAQGKGSEMTNEEILARLSALETSNKQQSEALVKAAAESEAMKAALQAAQSTARAQILAEGVRSGRITPAMQATVSKFAATCGDDLAAVQAFVDALPVQTAPAAVGTIQDRQTAVAKRSAALPDGMTEKDLKIQRQLLGGLDMKALEAADSVVSVSSDGMALLKDGTSRPLVEVMGEK